MTLETLAGQQIGVNGSYCVEHLASGCGHCADRGVMPAQFTIVHPGDNVVFSMPTGTLVAGKRCNPACPPVVEIQPAACSGTANSQHLIEEDQVWTVDLLPGTYTLWLNSSFEGPNGLTGGLYAGFGLIVDAIQPRAIVDAASVSLVCDAGMNAD